jgi:hypothetical protein
MEPKIAFGTHWRCCYCKLTNGAGGDAPHLSAGMCFTVFYPTITEYGLLECAGTLIFPDLHCSDISLKDKE